MTCWRGLRRVAGLVSLCACASLPGHADDGDSPAAVLRLDPASTRVLFMRVNLTVGELYLVEDAVEGTYSIDVPLRSSRSENGVLSMALERSFASYAASGGKLRGEGWSEQHPEEQRLIECRLTPDPGSNRHGEALFSVDTGSRVLHFTARYTVLGAAADGDCP